MTKPKNPSKGWDYLATLYLYDGSITYEQIGAIHGVSGSTVGNALDRLPKGKGKQKFSILPEFGNK